MGHQIHSYLWSVEWASVVEHIHASIVEHISQALQFLWGDGRHHPVVQFEVWPPLHGQELNPLGGGGGSQIREVLGDGLGCPFP